MSRTFLVAAAVLGVLVASSPTRAQSDGYRPRVGKLHPEIVLPRIDTREPVSLSDYRGKKVLLIHFASW